MLPIKSYIVVGPGRTGSKYIVNILRHFYLQNRIFLKENFIENLEGKSIEPFHIYHSHTKEIIKLENKNTKIILSIRNVVNSALSWCINPYIKKFHLFQDDLLKTEVVPFYLDPQTFIFHYNYTKNFYQYFTKESIEKITIINYDDVLHSDGRRLNYDVILNKLNLKSSTDPQMNQPQMYFPVKNPGTYPQWIKNWEEIKSISDDLETDPTCFFKTNLTINYKYSGA
jgi:hypothetical protein